MRYAAYCGTRNIYGDMEAAARSLVANSAVDRVFFVIEDAEFPRELPDIVECIDVSDQKFFKKKGPNMSSRFTYMAMMRIALCHVLPPEVDKVLSLDADTFAIRDITDVWDTPTDGCYFAAAEEWSRTESEGLTYTNFGVVLYDLDAMRGGKADEIVAELNRVQYDFVEQDAGNYMCQGAIAPMDGTYNSCWWTTRNAPNPRLIHFAGAKPDEWKLRREYRTFAEMTWDKAMELHAITVGKHG